MGGDNYFLHPRLDGSRETNFKPTVERMAVHQLAFYVTIRSSQRVKFAAILKGDVFRLSPFERALASLLPKFIWEKREELIPS